MQRTCDGRSVSGTVLAASRGRHYRYASRSTRLRAGSGTTRVDHVDRSGEVEPDRHRAPEGEAATAGHREATRIRERLSRIQDQLRRQRAEARVLAEQVDFLRGAADDAETRKLVSQTPLADRDWRQARSDLDRHAVQLDEARQAAAALEDERDRLLDRLLELEEDT
jgi:chromosome segregation ATPase